jgi:hypothetical protein
MRLTPAQVTPAQVIFSRLDPGCHIGGEQINSLAD